MPLFDPAIFDRNIFDTIGANVGRVTLRTVPRLEYVAEPFKVMWLLEASVHPLFTRFLNAVPVKAKKIVQVLYDFMT
jgi:hypothetical protein